MHLIVNKYLLHSQLANIMIHRAVGFKLQSRAKAVLYGFQCQIFPRDPIHSTERNNTFTLLAMIDFLFALTEGQILHGLNKLRLTCQMTPPQVQGTFKLQITDMKACKIIPMFSSKGILYLLLTLQLLGVNMYSNSEKASSHYMEHVLATYITKHSIE